MPIPRTGTAPLAEYIADVAAETSDAVAAADGGEPGGDTGGGQGTAVTGLANALDALAAAARTAAAAAKAGNRGQAEQRLDAVNDRLERVAERLAAATDSLPASLARAADRRLDQVGRLNEQARAGEKLCVPDAKRRAAIAEAPKRRHYPRRAERQPVPDPADPGRHVREREHPRPLNPHVFAPLTQAVEYARGS